MRDALTLLAQRLEEPRCRALLDEFSAEDGRPLADRLRALRLDHRAYLETIHFVDGDANDLCSSGQAFAFTASGSRVVYVCNGEFERLWPRRAQHGQSVVIHEVLHTLGLPENPPPGHVITRRVYAACVW